MNKDQASSLRRLLFSIDGSVWRQLNCSAHQSIACERQKKRESKQIIDLQMKMISFSWLGSESESRSGSGIAADSKTREGIQKIQSKSWNRTLHTLLCSTPPPNCAGSNPCRIHSFIRLIQAFILSYLSVQFFCYSTLHYYTLECFKYSAVLQSALSSTAQCSTLHYSAILTHQILLTVQGGTTTPDGRNL